MSVIHRLHYRREVDCNNIWHLSGPKFVNVSANIQAITDLKMSGSGNMTECSTAMIDFEKLK